MLWTVGFGTRENILMFLCSAHVQPQNHHFLSVGLAMPRRLSPDPAEMNEQDWVRRHEKRTNAVNAIYRTREFYRALLGCVFSSVNVQ